MSELTDTQLIILSAASQRDDRGVELPANVKGKAARKAADKLIRAGLLEEVRAAGSLPDWRRDDETGPMALGVTERASKRSTSTVRRRRSQADKRPPGARPGDVETPAPKAVAARKRTSVATQKSARKKHHPGKAKTKAGAPHESRSGSTSSRARDAGPT